MVENTYFAFKEDIQSCRVTTCDQLGERGLLVSVRCCMRRPSGCRKIFLLVVAD